MPEVSTLVEDVPSVTPDEFVTRVRKLMREERVHELPVVDDDETVEGVIRQRDLLNVTSTKSNVTTQGYVDPVPDISSTEDAYTAVGKMVRMNLDVAPVRSDTGGRYVGGLVLSTAFDALALPLSGEKVSDWITDEVECCDAEEPVSKAWIRMMESGYTGFPVLKDGELVGIITASDVIQEGHARVKRESRKGENARDSSTVESIMSTPVETVKTHSELGKALGMMKDYDVGRIPVVNDESIVGIVDRYDVIEAALEEKND